VIRRSAPTVAGDRIFDFRLGSDLTYRTEWNGVPDDWPNHLSLPDSGETWRWGHGRGLQGTGHAARPCGRIEISSRKAEAMALLKRARTAGWSKWDWVPRDPDLACLQDDPEFQQFIAEGQRKS